MYPRQLTGLTKDNMIVTELYTRLLTGPKENKMIVTNLYPRLMTGLTEDNKRWSPTCTLGY